MINIKEVVLKGRHITVLQMWFEEVSGSIVRDYFEANIEVKEDITYTDFLDIAYSKKPQDVEIIKETFKTDVEGVFQGQLLATVKIKYRGQELEMVMGVLPNIYEYEGEFYNLVEYKKDVENKFIKY